MRSVKESRAKRFALAALLSMAVLLRGYIAPEILRRMALRD